MPWHAYGGRPSFQLYGRPSFQLSHEHWNIARHVAALQVFSGETDLQHQRSLDSTDPASGKERNRDKGRKLVVADVLFQDNNSIEKVKAVIAGVKQVVQARQRGSYREGSALEDICRTHADNLRFHTQSS